jgi:hypothetical protein
MTVKSFLLLIILLVSQCALANQEKESSSDKIPFIKYKTNIIYVPLVTPVVTQK